MTDKLKQEFLPRFFVLAKERVEAAGRAVLSPTSPVCAEAARALHALAGEAGLLGLQSILSAAREAELAASKLAKAPSDRSLKDCLEHALTELAAAIERAEHPPSAPKASGSALRERFRARFVEGAMARYRRIATALGTVGHSGLEQARAELHALGGEASLLAMTAIATLCHDGEEAAREKDVTRFKEIVEQLEIAIFAEDVNGGRS